MPAMSRMAGGCNVDGIRCNGSVAFCFSCDRKNMTECIALTRLLAFLVLAFEMKKNLKLSRSPSSFAWPNTNANADLNVFLDHNHITSLDSTQYIEVPVGTTTTPMTVTAAPTPSSQPCRNQQGSSNTYSCICTGTRLVLKDGRGV